jgi:hypothetical protein
MRGSYAGQMSALDAETGNILLSFESGGSVLDGPINRDMTSCRPDDGRIVTRQLVEIYRRCLLTETSAYKEEL